VYIASGAAPLSRAMDAKVIHLPYTELLKPDGTPKLAKEIWGVLTKAGVPRYAETQNYVKQITNMYWSGQSIRSFGPANSTSSTTPARMFRGSDGKIVITNED
jgi:hypothetical protein